MKAKGWMQTQTCKGSEGESEAQIHANGCVAHRDEGACSVVEVDFVAFDRYGVALQGHGPKSRMRGMPAEGIG